MVVAWRHEAAGTLRVADTRSFDREAEFERLVLPLKDRMMRTVWRVTRDPELAEDAFQDALLTTWRKLPQVAAHPNPPALVLRLCLTAAVDRGGPLPACLRSPSSSQTPAAPRTAPRIVTTA